MKTKTKLIAGGIGAFFLASIIYNAVTGQMGEEAAAPTNVQVMQDQPSTVSVAPITVASSTVPTVDPEVTKQNAIDADIDMWLIALAIERANADLIEAMQSTELDTTALYAEAESIKETLLKYNDQAADVECEGIGDYSQAVGLYAIAGTTVCNSLMKYIDEGQPKYLSDTEDAIEYLPMYVMEVNKERTAFLKAAGLTDEDLTKIIQ